MSWKSYPDESGWVENELVVNDRPGYAGNPDESGYLLQGGFATRHGWKKIQIPNSKQKSNSKIHKTQEETKGETLASEKFLSTGEEAVSPISGCDAQACKEHMPAPPDEGGRHGVFVNRTNQKTSTVPRHPIINDYLARKICRDLHIPEP